jgi:hypothetical protein
MPIDFPNSPSNNQTYTYNDRAWVYNSTAGAWISQGGAVAAVGSQGPQGPTSNATTISVAPIFAGALIAANASKSLSATTWTALNNLGEIIYDTNNFVSTPSRLTIPAGVSKVKLSGAATGASATAQFITRIRKNGSADISQSTAVDIDSSGDDSSVAITPVLNVSANDYFELWAYSENTRTVSSSNVYTWFSIEVVEGSILSNTATAGVGITTGKAIAMSIVFGG